MENEQNQNLNTPDLASQGLALQDQNSKNWDSTPNASSKWIKFGIIAVILLVLLGGSYILGKNNSNKQVSQTPTPIGSPKPTAEAATPDETANWKTYTNPYAGYSIEYPSNWTQLAVERLTRFFPPGVKIAHGLGPDDPNTPYISIEFGDINPENCRGDCPLINKAEAITLGSLSARKLTGIIGTIGGGCGCSFQEIVIKKENTYYYITLYGQGGTLNNPPLSAANLTIFNQILSTFKFTDQTTSPKPTSVDTSSWKTYNGVYVSFRYPSSWNPTKKDLWGGEILEGVTLNISGATDNQIGFSDVDYSSLQKPQDIVQKSEVLIGGRNGVKYIRKGNNYFTYDYLTYGKNDKSKSFDIHVTVSKEDKNLENQLDQLINSIKFTQ